MSDRKYSVFISSTYDDLREAREEVLRAVLQSGHFPLGMEFWGAADQTQWEIIKGQIDVADYYIVIIAHRYGTEHEGKSWTEREYDYAIEKGVPVLGFLIDKGVHWDPAFIDDGKGKAKLMAFKKKVQNKPVSFWTSTSDLKTNVIADLHRQIATKPRTGWIRGSDGASVEITNELVRLSQENSRLRTELQRAAGAQLPDVGFEVDRAIIGVYIHQDFMQFNYDLTVHAVLRRPPAVGFRRSTSKTKLHFSDILTLTSHVEFYTIDGSMLSDISIAGPTSFRLIGRAETVYSPDCLRGDVAVHVHLKPVGYDMEFQITALLKPAHSGASKLQWTLKASA